MIRRMVLFFVVGLFLIPTVCFADGIVNPSTFDNGLGYFGLAGISLIGIVIILIIVLNKKK